MGFGDRTVVGFGVVMDSCHFMVSLRDLIERCALESNPIKVLLLGGCNSCLVILSSRPATTLESDRVEVWLPFTTAWILDIVSEKCRAGRLEV